jgi:hypothetical protein
LFGYITNEWCLFVYITNEWCLFGYITNDLNLFGYITNEWCLFGYITNKWYLFGFKSWKSRDLIVYFEIKRRQIKPKIKQHRKLIRGEKRTYQKPEHIPGNPRRLDTLTTRYLDISVLTWTSRYWIGHLGTRFWTVRDLDETIRYWPQLLGTY